MLAEDVKRQIYSFMRVEEIKMPMGKTMEDKFGISYEGVGKGQELSYYGLDVFSDKWKTPNGKILNVFTNSMNGLDFVRMTYDTDLIKIAFHQRKLHVYNWMKIIRKKDWLLPVANNNYEIEGDVILQTEMGADYKRPKYRCEKYRARGFDIMIYPKVKIIERIQRWSVGGPHGSDPHFELTDTCLILDKIAPNF